MHNRAAVVDPSACPQAARNQTAPSAFTQERRITQAGGDIMKRMASVMAAGLVAGFAAAPGTAGLPGQDQLQRQHSLCFTACRIECQYLHQGDQAAISQCYVQCTIDRCGR